MTQDDFKTNAIADKSVARQLITGSVLLGLFGIWAYWPTLLHLQSIWDREPDYSHGYLVIPLFLFFLYIRRSSFPAVLTPSWIGLVVLLGSIVLRVVGGVIFITPLDGWSIVLWVGGVALCLGGWPLLRWCLGPTLFLAFMVPLPFRYETLISQPLQRIAAILSSFVLRCIGQPAFAEETTIIVGTEILQVEQSCSGLRIFVGVFALTCGYLLAFRRELWEASLLIVAVIPVALVANAIRIVVTAILYRHYADEVAQKFSHDFAGYLMIPLAAFLLWTVQWYLNCLIPDVRRGDVSDLMKQDDLTAAASPS